MISSPLLPSYSGERGECVEGKKGEEGRIIIVVVPLRLSSVLRTYIQLSCFLCECVWGGGVEGLKRGFGGIEKGGTPPFAIGGEGERANPSYPTPEYDHTLVPSPPAGT